MTRISGVRPVGTQLEIEVEFPNAYTDGSSAYKYFTVAPSANPDEIKAQIHNQLSGQAGLVGMDIGTTPPVTKKALEPGLIVAYETWQRWLNTYKEAVAMSAPTNIVIALNTRRAQAWDAYWNAIQDWRLAP